MLQFDFIIATRSLEKRGNVQAAVSRLKTFTSALQVNVLMIVILGGNVGVIMVIVVAVKVIKSVNHVCKVVKLSLEFSVSLQQHLKLLPRHPSLGFVSLDPSQIGGSEHWNNLNNWITANLISLQAQVYNCGSTSSSRTSPTTR